MSDPRPLAQDVAAAGAWNTAEDRLVLAYEDRFLRRKQLRTEAGETLLIDFEHARSLDEGEALVLTDGRFVEVQAAPEPLTEIKGTDLQRFAWHIGNRHSPCQIEPDRLLIQRNHVLSEMLERLGASLRDVEEPFRPEGGAYGHGRTHGHSHD